jgi:hypothetical protein
LVCCQLPFIFSHIVFTSGEMLDDVVVAVLAVWACTIIGVVPMAMAAQAAAMAMGRMEVLLFLKQLLV